MLWKMVQVEWVYPKQTFFFAIHNRRFVTETQHFNLVERELESLNDPVEGNPE